MSIYRPRFLNIKILEEFGTPTWADAFSQHKKALLEHLRQVHQGDLKSEPFDEKEPWRRLTDLAQTYFWEDQSRQEEISAADRVKRLHQLAKALGKAHDLALEAMQGCVGTDVFRAWAGDPQSRLAAISRDLNYPMRVLEELEKAIDSLETFKTAALRAAQEVRTGRGRPTRTSVLPPDFIEGLAVMYRKSTGRTPGRGEGPFARFVREFLTAIGRRTITDDYVVELIKDFCNQARQNPARRRPSPFDE